MSAWHEFFHAPQDLSALAAFRVLVGGIVVASAISYARAARSILDPDGLAPFRVWQTAPDRHFVSVLRWLPPTAASVRVVLAAYAVAGVALALGLATTWAAAAVFAIGVSLHHRNRFVMHSGDAVLRVLTFLLIFADSGRVWSLDAAFASAPVDAVGSSWALRLMQLHLAALYLQSVWFKWKGRNWRDGTASHYATRLLAHRRLRLPAWADTPIAHRLATWATLAVELAGGTLVWLDATRGVTLVGLAALHLSLQLLMRMHVFQWTMLAALLLFVPGADVAAIVAAVLG